jgi:hypothetical protein
MLTLSTWVLQRAVLADMYYIHVDTFIDTNDVDQASQ